MPKVVGVRFHGVGKAYSFAPGDLDLHGDDIVVVETAQGVEIGVVTDQAREVEETKLKSPLRPVLRLATEEDRFQYEENLEREDEGYRICRQRIDAHGLEMHLVDVECAFDRSRMIFYFTAEGRVDFRALVRDLAQTFRMRIELRQIGVRDEARMVGGLGVCGRPLCCATFLTDFVPVSIKMAKDQNLSMNPGKISGCCGRLMCCLKYEQEAYEVAKKRLPRQGATLQLPEGKAKVESVDVLKETFVCRFVEDAGESRLLTSEDYLALKNERKPAGPSQPVEEKEALGAEEKKSKPGRGKSEKPSCGSCGQGTGGCACPARTVSEEATEPTMMGLALDEAYQAETSPSWLDAEVYLEDEEQVSHESNRSRREAGRRNRGRRRPRSPRPRKENEKNSFL